ncbi:hypothetical protein GCM10011409_24230 [Lentibacillus populi]|uniref:PucR family transcriptional regulator n=1 Tax=Lentibacillus populi TaxID=1827502 RepID=A0A9W5TXX0_9BACI|nr:helix-turn-helix domain-containing protein [Lentibacillus populi]GGB45801.1 hypothetical protein GCM10011409_24230 [Lentibacillus populi]
MITVKEFAKELLNEDIELIAGDSDIGLNGRIEYLSVQELSEKTSRIKENGFIMTTFNAFKDIEHIVNHMAWFVKRGVKAVGFHTAVYKEVPKEIIEFAISQSLPLFYIPSDVSYSQIFDRFNQLLNKKDNIRQEEVNKLNEKMLESVFLEKDTDYIVNLIGNYINNIVVYLDPNFNVVSSWENRVGLDRDVDSLVKDIINNHYSALSKVRFSNQITELCLDELDGFRLSITLTPIYSTAKYYGILLTSNKNRNGMFVQDVIKHGTTVLRLIADRKNALDDQQKMEDINIFESIFRGDFKGGGTTTAFDCNKVKNLLLVEQRENKNLSQSFQVMDHVLNRNNREGLVWITNKKIIGIAQDEVDQGVLDEIISESSTVIIGVSSKLVSPDIEDIHNGYLQCRTALNHAIRRGLSYSKWDEIGLDKIVYVATEHSLFNHFDNEVLGPIIDYDKNKGTDLLHTLHSYLRNFFNLKETGQELFLHPNSIKYRLKKIMEILNINIHDPDNYMMLYFAFKMGEVKNQNFVDEP